MDDDNMDEYDIIDDDDVDTDFIRPITQEPITQEPTKKKNEHAKIIWLVFFCSLSLNAGAMKRHNSKMIYGNAKTSPMIMEY